MPIALPFVLPPVVLALAHNTGALITGGIGVFWKIVGKLSYPVIRTWVSRGPTLGFLTLVSVRYTHLQQSALDVITKALLASLPIRASKVSVDRLTLKVGFLVGVRVWVSGLRVELAWTPEEARWEEAVSDIRQAALRKSRSEAHATISLVQNYLKPQGVGPCVRRIVEALIHKGIITVDNAHFSIVGCNADIEIITSLQASTAKSRAVERKGTGLAASLSLAMSAGGKEALAPTQVKVNVDLPRILGTVLVPQRLPNKKAKVNAVVSGVDLKLRPCAVRALMGASTLVGQFTDWKARIIEEAEGEVIPIAPGELDDYANDLAKGKDVSKWEQRMTGDDIVKVYRERQKWPVPVGLELEDWCEELNEEQKPLRAISATVSVRGIVLELLNDEDTPGHGIAARVPTLEAAFTDTGVLLACRPVPEPVVRRWFSSASSAEPGEPIPAKFMVEVTLRSMEVSCEPHGHMMMPMLEPCTLLAKCTIQKLDGDKASEEAAPRAAERRDSELPVAERKEKGTMHVAAHMSLVENSSGCAHSTEDGVISATISSRAVWKLLCITNSITAAMPPPDTKPQKKGQVLEAKRRAVHMAEVRRVFKQLDTDNSGELEQAEISQLMSSIYGQYMTTSELRIAAEQLFKLLDANCNGGVSLDELQTFFDPSNKKATYHGFHVSFIGDYRRPVADSLDALATFKATVGAEGEDSSGVKAEVLQMRWVRTLQNYAVAERTWVRDIAPTLDSAYHRWRLDEQTLARDFWNDPAFIVALPQRSSKAADDLVLDVHFHVQGLSLQLSDSQHASSTPRVRVDISNIRIEGGVETDEERPFPHGKHLVGECEFKASYWNQSRNLMEPFIEPWKAQLEADGDTMKVSADQHMVINLTPPLLQAASVASVALQDSDKPSSVSMLYCAEDRPVMVWVFNRTLCDIAVRARGAVGAGRPVEISRLDFARPVGVELLEPERAPAGGDTQDEGSWTLSLEGKGDDPWSVPEEISFSVTGRQIFAAGDRLIAVTVSVDVHSQAPIVTVSGICTLQNLTNKTLYVGEAPHCAEVGPQDSWECGIGGGHTVALIVSGEGVDHQLTVDIPTDTYEIEGGTSCQYSSGYGYRFILCQQEDALRSSKAQSKTLICVPVICVQNALPCGFKCMVQNVASERQGYGGYFTLSRGGNTDRSELISGIDLPFEMVPGAVQGFDDIDPLQPTVAVLEFAGARYSAWIPEAAITSWRTVQKARKMRGKDAIKLLCDDPTAPHLDVELDWDSHRAVLVVFARYWITNKTGFKVDAASGMKKFQSAVMAGVATELVTPTPLDGQPWSGTTPELAFMQIENESFQLRLQGLAHEGPWAWTCKAPEAPITHWLGVEPVEAPKQPDPGTGNAETEPDREAEPDAAAPVPDPGPEPDVGQAPGTEEPQAGADQVESREPTTEEPDQPPEPSAEEFELIDVTAEWESDWSAKIPVSISNTGGDVSLAAAPSGREHLKMYAPTEWSLGVSIADMPAPFMRSKLITVVPRYVVRSDLDEAISVWPGLGSTTRPPTVEAPPFLPVLQPGSCLALYRIPHSSGLVASGSRRQAMIVVGFNRENVERKWSVKIPLLVVAETVLVLGAGTPEDPYKVVRVSVQHIGATMFVTLSKGQWPYRVDNYSVQYTVACHQTRTKGHEWTLKPCEFRNFHFPDPELPNQLSVRICGAGRQHVRRYDLDDKSKMGTQEPLMFLSSEEPVLEARLRMVGSTYALELLDPVRKDKRQTRTRRSTAKTADIALAKAKKLQDFKLDVFITGLHVCLVDTTTAVSQELIGLTVDYIQLWKPKRERSLKFAVHNVQLDDFSREDCFIFGPSESGLNSVQHALANTPDFKANPMLYFACVGPKNPRIQAYDAEYGMINIQKLVFDLRPTEAHVDVPRLVALALMLKSWSAVIETGDAGSARTARRALAKVLAPGFTVPKSLLDNMAYIANLDVMEIDLALNVKLKKRQGDNQKKEEEDEDLEGQLRKLATGSFLRPFIGFLLRLGTSVAEVSPKFKFDAMTQKNLHRSTDGVKEIFIKYYTSKLTQQVGRVLGSLQVLGDPVRLVDDVTGGFENFYKKTKQELKGEKEGIGGGVHDLAGGIVGGALDSVSKISGSLKDTVGSIAGKPLGSDKRAESIAEGVDLGIASLAAGISEAVTGLVDEPMDHVSDGVIAVCRGSALGVLGLLTRPVEGFFGAVEKIAQGAEGTVRGLSRGYHGLRRPPRVNFGVAGYDNDGLQTMQQGLFWPQWLARINNVSLRSLWKERRVLEVVLTLAQAEVEALSEIHIARRRKEDTWALLGTYPDNMQARGRVGALRGPFRLQVDVYVAPNLEMTHPFRVTVGMGELPSESLTDALQLRDQASTPLKFSIISAGDHNHVIGHSFAANKGGVLGEVEIELSGVADRKLMPRHFFTADAEDEAAEDPAKTRAKLLQWVCEQAEKPVADLDDDAQAQLRQEDAYHEVYPHLFLGGACNPKVIYYIDGHTSTAQAFGLVIRASEEESANPAAQIQNVFVLPGKPDPANEGQVSVGTHSFDNEPGDKNQLFRLAFLIQEDLENGKNVLVHCTEGIDLSVTVVAAFLLLEHPELTVQQVQQFIVSQRRVAQWQDSPSAAAFLEEFVDALR